MLNRTPYHRYFEFYLWIMGGFSIFTLAEPEIIRGGLEPKMKF